MRKSNWINSPTIGVKIKPYLKAPPSFNIDDTNQHHETVKRIQLNPHVFLGHRAWALTRSCKDSSDKQLVGCAWRVQHWLWFVTLAKGPGFVRNPPSLNMQQILTLASWEGEKTQHMIPSLTPQKLVKQYICPSGPNTFRGGVSCENSDALLGYKELSLGHLERWKKRVFYTKFQWSWDLSLP